MRKVILASAAIALLGVGVVAQAATTVITTLDGTQGWKQYGTTSGGTASIVDLTGQGGNLETSQPLASGAVKLTTDMTNAAKAEVGIESDFGLASALLSDAKLTYNFYKQDVSGGNVFAAPSIKLTIYAAGGTGDNYGTLVYEPYWVGNNVISPTDAWQSVSINSSTGAGSDAQYGWWWNGGFGQATSSAGPPVRSLGEWLTAFQSSDSTDFANAHIVGLSVGVGSYNQGQIGYFDNVSIKSVSGGVDTVYDFQTAAVPEPAFFQMGALLGMSGLGCLKLRRKA
jgi:hypothetical protein